MSGEQHPSVLVAFGSDLLELQNLFYFPSLQISALALAAFQNKHELVIPEG